MSKKSDLQFQNIRETVKSTYSIIDTSNIMNYFKHFSYGCHRQDSNNKKRYNAVRQKFSSHKSCHIQENISFFKLKKILCTMKKQHFFSSL